MNPKMKQILDKFSLGRNEVIVSRFTKQHKISRNGLHSILSRLQNSGYITYGKEPFYGREDKVTIGTVVNKIKNA